MTAKEKAEALVEKYRGVIGGMAHLAAKQCAIVAVEEVIATYTNTDNTYWLFENEVDYWNNVKIEIEKL